MEDLLKFELTSDDPAEISRLLDKYLQALRRILEQIEKDEEVIDRNTAETWLILNQLQDQMRKAA
jgi:hypothetical protein